MPALPARSPPQGCVGVHNVEFALFGLMLALIAVCWFRPTP